MEGVKLDGKTVIVTGSNTGIGKQTVLELARRGARVIMACRSLEKAEDARRDIVAEAGSNNVVCMQLDVSSLQSVKRFAEKFNQEESRLDLLVNNAGVWALERSVTADGFEIHFGTNHLGHFYLTYLLMDKLKASAPSRIVTVSSSLHKGNKLVFDDLQFEHGWSSQPAYGRSKSANILFTVQLSKILAGTGVTAYSLHPGVVSTELSRNFNPYLMRLITCCFGCCYKTPEQGARTTLYCCLEPRIASHSGRFYEDCHETRAADHATDGASAERLWNISMELCKLT